MRTRLLSCALLLTASTLLAQSFTPVRELKNLSPSAIEKLHTLETLNSLPADEWRFHAGDLPHGESTTLDDSTWPVAKAPSKAPKDAVWYRRTIEVPRTLHGYDITGSRVWFQFRAEANGPMPQIIYFNGRRVALGDDLEPIVLFEPAHPGDKILVAVKLLHTVDEKSFRGVTLRIEPVTDTTAARPNPDDIRIQAITAANLLPDLTPSRRDLLPQVEAAINAIDMQALAAGNQTAFDDSLRKSQSILSTLHEPLSHAQVTEAGNSHIDAAWLWPRSETIDVVHRTFTTALQLMNEYPDYTFTQSAAQYSAWMADKYPELNAEIAQRIKEGRWEIVGGMWVEPDLNIPDGESLVRQLLVGQREFRSLYGVTARIGWNPDSFGYNWQLPQIYKRSGLDYFVTQKMHWNDTNQLPFRLFWWQSPDGSKVLTYFPTDYVHSNVNPTRISADFAESAQRNPGTMQHLDLYGIGDHGGGPTRDMLDQADHWIAMGTSASSASATGAASKVSGTSEGAGGFSPLNASPQTNGALAPDATVATNRSSSGLQPAVNGPSREGASAPGRSSTATPTQASLVKGTASAVPSTPQTKEGALAPEVTAAVPTLHYGTTQSFFSSIEPHLNPTSPTWNYASLAKGYTPPQPDKPGLIGLPTWNDELYFEYHRGIYTSQAHHKASNRKSETATLDAEKLASFAWLYGQPYPAADLTENWKKITFNQFHDLAAGSGIAVIYRDAQDDYKQVFDTDHAIANTSLQTIGARIDTAFHGARNVVPVLVTNSLAWQRSGTQRISIQLPEGADEPVVADARGPLISQVISVSKDTNTFDLLVHLDEVPPVGYALLTTISDREGKFVRRVSDLHLNENAASYILTNSHLQVFVNKSSGCITSLTTAEEHYKPADYLAPNSCGNQLQAFPDNPKQYDAWNIDPGTLDKAPTILSQLDSIKLVEDGPLRKTIRIERTFNKSHITQNISLAAGSDVINIATDIDWHEQHTLLKAAFPLAHSSDHATYEIPYGSITRPTTRNNNFEKAKFEVPALRWADLGDATAGLSILNDSKYGYDALGNTLRITLLRSPTWPDPDADQGPQHFTYALYPHTGTWQQAQTVHRAYELNTPLIAQQVFPHTGTLPPTHSFASIDNPNVTLTAIKKAEDADALVFRMYEWAGTASDVKLHVPPGATYAVESNLMEKPEGPHLPLASDTVTVPIKPFEILTVMVYYPARTATASLQ